jgi:hypothetical protein
MTADRARAHDIASHMSTATPDFTLEPKQSRTVQVVLNNTDQLAPGGHYGALTYEITPSQTDPSLAANRVAFKQTIASLLFVTTKGSGSYGLRLYKPQASLAWWHAPSSYTLAFQNTGNIQLTPRGYLSINGPRGHLQAKGLINPDSGIVLPDTSRVLEVPVSRLSSSLLPGIYTVHTYYRYDGSTDYTAATSRFLYVGPLTIIMLVCAALLLVVGLRYRAIRAMIWHHHGKRRKK